MNAASHPRLHILSHPLLAHSLTLLRDRHTSRGEFRRLVGEVSRLMAYECARGLKLSTVSIQTPFEQTQGQMISEDITLLSVFRAGMSMVDGFLQMFPLARVGHIGIYRDKFMDSTVEYYFRIPQENLPQSKIFLLDPLLATGSTVNAALERLKQYGATSIHVNCLLASPEGAMRILEAHPDISISCLALERGLDAKGYLLPGLGDAGERLYGTA